VLKVPIFHVRRLMLTTVALTPRQDLILGIVGRMLEYRVVHIRGTPAFGKSVLYMLVQRYLANHYPRLQLAAEPYWPSNMDSTQSKDFIEKTLQGTLDKLQCELSDRVLILDKAQSSYYDPVLWNTLLKQLSQTNTGMYAILFRFYGATEKAPVMIRHCSSTLLFPHQRIGLSWNEPAGEAEPAGLLLRLDESLDLCRRFCKRLSPALVLSEELCEWIYNLTGGHVGAYTSLLYPFVRRGIGPPRPHHSKSN
jgi:hypothetical protein